MPMLEDKFHCIAPDYPGFGNTDSPSREEFAYTFDHLAEAIDGFIEALHIDKFYMYVFDYGAPIGFRIALKLPEKILGMCCCRLMEVAIMASLTESHAKMRLYETWL